MSNRVTSDGNRAPAPDENENRFREMVETVNSIILKWNIDLRITFVNSFGARFFGFSKDELVGKHLMESIVPNTESTGRSLHEMFKSILTQPEKFVNNENENVTKSGKPVWISWSNFAEKDECGMLRSILSVGNDITSLKKAQMDLKKALTNNETLLREMEELNGRLEIMARFDQLTGLLNRCNALDRLEEELFRAVRQEYPLGVLMIDVDRFKSVNDSFGHAIGDTALKVIAEALKTSVRKDDTVARLGGEEICVILPYASTARCWNTAERLRLDVEQATSNACRSGQLPKIVTVSIGGVSTDRGIISGEKLLKIADKMMYKSKTSGRNMCTVFGFDDMTD